MCLVHCALFSAHAQCDKQYRQNALSCGLPSIVPKVLRLVAAQQTCSMYMYMCLSRLTVTANVVQHQVVISDACNHLVHKNERVLSVVWHLDDIMQLCVVIIRNHTGQVLVEVIAHLKALIS